MSVYFHANFGLNRNNMAEILKAALKDPLKRDKQLAAPFGYGPAFAARTRSWLHKTGIAEQGFPVSLTEKGKEVWEKDPKLGSIKRLTTFQ